MTFLISFLALIVLMMAAPYILRFAKTSRAPVPATIFVAHWIEVWTLRLQFRRYRHLQQDPHDTVMTVLEWIVFGFLSLCRAVSPMAYDVVNDFTIGGKHTQIWLVNFNIWHFIIPGFTRYIIWKMLRTVHDAKRKGVRFVGLGALLKDRGLTDDGMYFADALGMDRPFLAHGDTLTAQTVFLQALALAGKLGTKRVFITGATSKIGRAIAIRLAESGFTVFLYSEGKRAKDGTDGQARVNAIMDEAGEYACNMVYAPGMDMAGSCGLIITGKRTGGQTLLNLAQPRTAFLNFSVPDPLTPELLCGRPLYHYDGGLLDYSAIPSTLTFAMRLIAGQVTYACHAWLLVCAMKGWTDRDELGPVKISDMSEFWTAAEECGFKLPEGTSFLHPMALPEKGAAIPGYSTPPPRRRRKEAI